MAATSRHLLGGDTSDCGPSTPLPPLRASGVMSSRDMSRGNAGLWCSASATWTSPHVALMVSNLRRRGCVLVAAAAKLLASVLLVTWNAPSVTLAAVAERTGLSAGGSYEAGPADECFTQ